MAGVVSGFHAPLWVAFLLASAAARPSFSADVWSNFGAGEQEAVIADISAATEAERARIAAPSIAVAIAAGRRAVWAGTAVREDARLARSTTAAPLYRVGAITELLTRSLVLRLAEEHRLHLDLPVAHYLPSFQPHPSFGEAITLRHLLSHGSGLPAEPPVGNYFDPNPVDLATTVASLSTVDLEFRPGTRQRRSRAGIALAGRVAEIATGRSYEDLLAAVLLGPWGMYESGVQLTPSVHARLAYSEIAPVDTNPFPAPAYQPGATPALGLYSSIGDLGRLAAAALREERFGRALRQARRLHGRSLLQNGEGFLAGRIGAHPYWAFRAHMPGQIVQLTMFESPRLAVVIVIALDSAEPSIERLTLRIVQRVLAPAAWSKTPVTSSAAPDGETARRAEGTYSAGTETVVLRLVNERLFLEGPDVLAEMRRDGNAWVLDDARTYRRDLSLDRDASLLQLGLRRYRRTTQNEPAPPPHELTALIGDYGWEHYYVRIYERNARLHARLGWNRYVTLESIGPDVYAIATHAASDRAQVVFSRTSSGDASAITIAGVRFARRSFGREALERIRNAVSADMPLLRKRAIAAHPPVDPQATLSPDLIAIADLDSSVEIDVRYASADNFLGLPIYDQSGAMLQRPAAHALVAAHRHLAKSGLGIVVHDAYRPWYVTHIFWHATPEHLRVFVADPAQGSRHNRGCAADVSLYRRSTGELVSMPGEYDEFSAHSSALYLGGTSAQRWRRDLLKEALESEGFAVYPFEWWHFDFRHWRDYPVMNVEFGGAEPR